MVHTAIVLPRELLEELRSEAGRVGRKLAAEIRHRLQKGYKVEQAGLKTKLTPRDRIKAAYLHEFHKMDQHAIAVVLDVKNVGRVNEDIMAVRKAVGLRDDGGYKDPAEDIPFVPIDTLRSDVRTALTLLYDQIIYECPSGVLMERYRAVEKAVAELLERKS